MRMSKFNINIQKGRSRGAKSWDLPSWSNPLSMGVMPLFVCVSNHLLPVGTAFIISKEIVLVASAEHALPQELRNHIRRQLLCKKDRLPEDYALDDISLYVLHNRPRVQSSFADWALWPLESVSVAQPSDIIISCPKLASSIQTLSFPLSFEVPQKDETVWCIGYTDFQYPTGGIPLEKVCANNFDWDSSYQHKLRVVEGRVQRVFTEKFTNGYVEGPCFSIDSEIFHGQSGGPVLNSKGFVCGVNCASASNFFGHPASLISLFYPLMLTPIKCGLQMGPVRLDFTHPFCHFIGTGSIETDGSERLVHVLKEEDGSVRVGPLVYKEKSDGVINDFDTFIYGREPRLESRSVYVLRRDKSQAD